MSGLKSGSGDDLWDDDDDRDPEDGDSNGDPPEEQTDNDDSSSQSGGSAGTGESTVSSSDGGNLDPSVAQQTSKSPGHDPDQPYIVRRAIRDRSVQFERNERLTFFVHDDVVTGERELVSEVESAVGRNVPKFDVREAVYRAALQNREDVLAELLKMGYTLESE